MKKRRIFTVLAALMVALVVTGVALAAFIGTPLTSTGSIAVAAGEGYTLDTVLVFGDSGPIATSSAITKAATLTITNDGLASITGFTLSSRTYPVTGTGWNLVVVSSDGNILTGETATLTFTLTGTAPSAAGTIDLTAVSCDITPTGP